MSWTCFKKEAMPVLNSDMDRISWSILILGIMAPQRCYFAYIIMYFLWCVKLYSCRQSRTAGYPTAPFQISACGFSAQGSSILFTSCKRLANSSIRLFQTVISNFTTTPLFALPVCLPWYLCLGREKRRVRDAALPRAAIRARFHLDQIRNSCRPPA